MLLVGLTGGIGAGKSTFASLLAERGAHVVDADRIGHEVLAPGQPAWHSTVDQFGDEILAAASLDIDRKRLAAIVFSDPAKLAALNAITHPVILRRVADEIDVHRQTDHVVILDAALIVEMGLVDALDLIVVVTSSAELRKQRLVKNRGMAPSDIDARMAAQAPQEDLIARADLVVVNDGDESALAAEADRVWTELENRAG